MAVPALKDHISADMVAALAGELTTAWPDFPAPTFTARASADLGELELVG